MEFKIAVLGATGYIGAPYRQEIRECRHEARIVSLCGRRLKLLKAAAEEDGAQLFSDDWRAVIEHPEVNLVMVCTPDALHHDAVMLSAQRGLHVLCEKPVAENSSQARNMWQAYRETGLGHFVPFWTRYVDAFRRAREIVKSGTLGAIRAFVYRWHNPRPAFMPYTWREDASLSSAGSIGDVGSHAYDVLRWILGEEARRVLSHAAVITPPKVDVGSVDLGQALAWGETHESADGDSHRESTTVDYGSLSIEMESGAVGTMILSHACFLRKGVTPEMELHGTEASLSVDRITGHVRLFRTGATPEIAAVLPDLGQGNRFQQYVFPGLRDHVAGRKSDHPGLDDGYRVQLFIDAAALAARRGGWVEIAEIEDENNRVC